MESTVLNTDLYSESEKIVLELYYHGFPVMVSPEETPFEIGRNDTSAGLSVSSEFASRKHCAVEFHGGKFMLRDFSRNGTFVQLSLSQSFRVQNESTPLIGNGCFKLGAAIGSDDGERIFFKVKTLSAKPSRV
jgi:adenylate cyclase